MLATRQRGLRWGRGLAPHADVVAGERQDPIRPNRLNNAHRAMVVGVQIHPIAPVLPIVPSVAVSWTSPT